MIELLRYLACIIGGASIGYFLASGKFDRDLEAAIVKESDDARAYWESKYRERLDALAKKQMGEYGGVIVGPEIIKGIAKDSPEAKDTPILDELSKKAEEEPEKVAAMPKSASIDRRTEPEAPQKVNYNAISTPSKATKAEEEAKAEEEYPKIDLITQQEFIDSDTGYKQMSFTYYPGDDVLANELMKRISLTDREIVIGKEAIPALLGGLETVYVRNVSGHWEIEIAKAVGNFSDEGYVE